MGFDNECIVNIQSLPGEYFCPYCRTLVYPNEALQSQCTHLYCKPCLVYVAATTRACPYDGYLVTEADSKLLVEANKSVAETIGKVAVRCLYCKSGCQWQGSLSDCITHCTECAYGNSPVICNRCSTQIMHRQVQEHGQTCLGVQPQAQQVEGQTQDPKVQGQSVSQDETSGASTVMSASSSTAVVSASVPPTAPAAPVQSHIQANAAAYPNTAVQAQTHEQWYQQQQLQYQQYYQQFPGYDSYQQQYQQYAQYQQQVHPQYALHQMQGVPQQVIQGQPQPQPYIVHQPQPHPHPHPQPQPQPQPQLMPQLPLQPQSQPQPQPQPVPQSQPQTQVTQPQLQQQHPPHSQLQPQPQSQAPAQQLHAPIQQSHPQTQPQTQVPAQQLHSPAQQTHLQAQPHTHPPPHVQSAGHQQLHPHALSHTPQSQPYHQLQPPQLQTPAQHQQSLPAPQQHPHPQMQHQQPCPQQQPHPHAHLQPQHQLPRSQTQLHPMPQPQAFPQQHPQLPSAHAVTAHQSYPQPQPAQQLPPGPPQQRPMQVHQQHHPQHSILVQNQFPPQSTPQMRAPHAQLPMQAHQQPTMMPAQGSHVNLRPTQQQAQPPVHQQIHQQPVIQPYGQQQGLPQPQAHAPLHPGQPQLPGAFPSQHLTHSQQPLRPPGPPYMQQQVPVQPHSQQNVMPGLPSHQAQSSRHTIPNHGMTHQQNQLPPASSVLAQSGVVLQQPNQNYPVRAATQFPSSSDHQPATTQTNQLTQPENHSALESVSPALQSVIHSNTLSNEPSKQSESTELKFPRLENDSKSVDTEEATVAEGNVDIKPRNENKGNLESVEPMHEKGLESHAQDEDTEEPVRNPLVKGEDSELVDAINGSLDSPKSAAMHNDNQKTSDPCGKQSGQGERMDSHQLPDGTGTVQPHVDSNKVVKGESSSLYPDKNNQSFVSQGQITEHIGKDMHAPKHMLHQNHQHDPHNPPAVSIPGQGGYPIQPGLYGHPPHALDSGLVHQRSPAPDGMFSQNMPYSGPNQERKFPDPSHHQMQVHGQAAAPSQMGPPNRHFPETFPHQMQQSIAQEPFQPPTGKPPHGPYHSEVPSSSISGPGFPASATFGFHHRNPGEQTSAPLGQNQNYMPPSHAVRPLGQPIMGGPLPGPRGPAFGIEGQMGPSRPANVGEAEGFAVRRTEFISRQQLVPLEHVPFGQPPAVKSNPMSMNGVSHDSSVSHGLPKERFGHVAEERFKSFPEQGFLVRHEEQFAPSATGAPAVNRREFEEDLKSFPRSAHLDREGMPVLDGYMSSSRPLDRVPQHFGPDVVPLPHHQLPYVSEGGSTSWPLPSYRPGGQFSTSTGVSPMDIGGRLRPVGHHEGLGRRHDISSGHPINRMDGLPPLRRSPGGEYARPGRFGSGSQSHTDDFGSRELHGIGDRANSFILSSGSAGTVFPESKFPRTLATGLPGYFDGPGNKRMVEKSSAFLTGSIRNDIDAPGLLPHRVGSGDPFGQGFPSHSRVGDPSGPGNLPSNLRFGDHIGGGNLAGHMDIEPGYGSRPDFPKETKHFNSDSFHGGLDSFDNPRMKKLGSIGWCRICKIDCETVEALDLHSQTREHQKMSMDMVLSIKQENARRQKLSNF